MVAQQDCSIGFGVETTYKTGVAPTVWPEYVEESLDWTKNTRQSQGLKVGGRVARSRRRVVPTAAGGGDVTIEAQSKALGKILRALLGSGASTLVSGSTYQQVFTLGTAVPDPLTIQRGLPMADGSVDATTFLGCMATGWEIACPNGDIATIRSSWDAGDIDTEQAYTAPSYATASNLFHFGKAKVYSGTLTEPTATALASGTEELANVRSFNVSSNNNPDVGRFNANGTGRKDIPLAGVREVAASLEVEHANTDFRDAILSDAPLFALFEFTAGALSTGLETFQIVLPELKFDTNLPRTNGGNLIIQSLTGAGLDNESAAQPIWIVQRTSDTAL